MINISIEFKLDVGFYDIDSNEIDIHSGYFLGEKEGRNTVNEILESLIDDDQSTYAQLMLVYSVEDDYTLLATFKKTTTCSGQQWVLTKGNK